MAEPTAETVLGDFDDAVFIGRDGETRFFMREGQYMVKTNGPDGKPTDYSVRYTLGWYPLQQYLLELDNGYIQALSVAWDSRPEAEGGQRWFHLYPDDTIDHRDVLHWTRPSQNWNFMCAECHTTDYQRNFNLDELSYNSKWMEHGVGCEGCHGPGSEHIKQATMGQFDAQFGLLTTLKRKQRFQFSANSATANPVGKKTHQQAEACGRCHSRREVINEPYEWNKPLLENYRLRLLQDPLYYSDGQIRDEVYVYGSFLQSKMHAAGVECADCHEPHSATLRVEGNDLCAQCHKADVFDTPKHHHHPKSSEASQCVSCHMPATTYMVVDPRRDHSFRIPRPDLNGEANRPDPCTQCHTDQDKHWASKQIDQWTGNQDWRVTHWGPALYSAANRHPQAAQALLDIASEPYPGIAKASALAALSSHQDPAITEILRKQLASEDPLVRMGAVQGLEGLPPGWALILGEVALTDPVRAVRLEAARVLAPAMGEASVKTRAKLQTAIDDYIATQQLNADRPQAHMNLGVLYSWLSQPQLALSAYQQALLVDPLFYQAYINMADIYRQQGNNPQALNALQTAVEINPQSADAHHALGLAYVRSRQLPKALQELEQAQRLANTNVRYAYVYAVALEASGNPAKAIDYLKSATFRFPGERDILYTLAVYLAKTGQVEAARKYVVELLRFHPEDEQGLRLARQLGLR